MEFDAVLLPARRAAMIAQGLWHDRTINGELDACLAACPDKLALTAYRVEAGDVKRFTYRQLAQMADRVAVGLSRLGVGRNDVMTSAWPWRRLDNNVGRGAAGCSWTRKPVASCTSRSMSMDRPLGVPSWSTNTKGG